MCSNSAFHILPVFFYKLSVLAPRKTMQDSNNYVFTTNPIDPKLRGIFGLPRTAVVGFIRSREYPIIWQIAALKSS